MTRLTARREQRPGAAAEVAYTALHESVASIGDFALRRTSLAWTSSDHGRSHADRIAFTLASVLDWPADRVLKAVAGFEEELSALSL